LWMDLWDTFLHSSTCGLFISLPLEEDAHP
jgi:hypothetical protein